MIKSQLGKHNGKLVLLEVGEERNKEKLEEAMDKNKEFQEKVLHLELEQRLGFEELRNFASLVVSLGSLGQDQVAGIEEDAMHQQSQECWKQDPSFL